MIGRFLAVASADEGQLSRLRRRADALGDSCIFDQPGLLVVATTGTKHLAIGDSGLLIGQAFTPRSDGALASMPAETVAAVKATAGAHLCELHWGGYVLVMATRNGEVIVLRAPLGELPCLYTEHQHATAVASDVTMLRSFGLYEPRVDYHALTRHLIASEIRRNDTCLVGLDELRGGQRLVIGRGGQARVETIWTPWRFAAEDMQIEDRDECDRRLRNAVRYVVRTRGRTLSPALLLLSGGLDSSILAACLAEAEIPFSSLTISTKNVTGDEREYARRAALKAGAALTERTSALSNIVIDQSGAANLPRPARRCFEQDMVANAAEAASLMGAVAILDGGGGDNVFGALQSVAPIVDSLRTGGFGTEFWRMVREISRLAETSHWQVAWRAFRRARRASQAYHWTPDLRLLAAEAGASVAAALDNPWLDMPANVLPGRAAHLAVLIPAQGLVEDCDPQAAIPSCSILVAQPIVETCLRIPSNYWFEHGNNRAAARRAFETMLPREIAWRRTKGTPDSFVVEIFEAHKGFIRAALVDGLLSANGLIDVSAVRTILDDPRPARGHGFTRVMQLLDAEIWARSWSAS